MKFNARVSLEELVADEPVVVPEVPVEEVVDGSESVETAVAVADDASAEIDAVVETADEAEEDAAELTEMAEILETSEETGGADPLAVQMAEVSVERFRQKYNIKQAVLPSLESFSDVKTRKSSTKVAVENLKEVAKNIWAKIVALYKKLAGWIGGFVTYVTDANVRMDAAFKQLASVKVEGAPKNATMPAGNLGKALQVGGTVTGAGVAKSLESVTAAADYSLDLARNFETEVGKVDVVAVAKEGADKVSFDFKSMNATGGFKKAGDEFGKQAEGSETLYSSEMAGGVAVVISGPTGTKTGDAAIAAAKSFKVSILPFPGGKKFEGDTIPVATGAEIASIAKNGAAFVKAASARKAQADTITKAIKDFTTKVEAAAKAPEGDGKGAKAAQALAAAFGKQMAGVMKASYGYGSTVAQNALHYAQKSAKQYGADVAAPAKDAKAAA